MHHEFWYLLHKIVQHNVAKCGTQMCPLPSAPEHLRQQADLPRWGAMWFAALDGAVDVDRRFYARHCKAVTAGALPVGG